MATGTRSGALRRYIGNIPASWELGCQLAREHIDYTAPEWREAFGLDRRPGCTTKQVVCFILTTPTARGGRGLSLRDAEDFIGVSYETIREHRDKAARFLAAHPPDLAIGRTLLTEARVRRLAPPPPSADADADIDFAFDRAHGWPAERWKLPAEDHWQMNSGGKVPWGYLTLSPLSVRSGIYYARVRVPESFAGLVCADEDMVPALACDELALLEWKRRFWAAKYPRRATADPLSSSPLRSGSTGATVRDAVSTQRRPRRMRQTTGVHT